MSMLAEFPGVNSRKFRYSILAFSLYAPFVERFGISSSVT